MDVSLVDQRMITAQVAAPNTLLHQRWKKCIEHSHLVEEFAEAVAKRKRDSKELVEDEYRKRLKVDAH